TASFLLPAVRGHRNNNRRPRNPNRNNELSPRRQDCHSDRSGPAFLPRGFCASAHGTEASLLDSLDLNRMNNAMMRFVFGENSMPTVRLAVLFFILTLNFESLLAQSASEATVHVDITPSHQLNSFDPDSALGSSLDVLSRRDIDRVHTAHIVQEALSAG